ncbi:MAG TPA: hypothetical protein VK821_12610 [Dehalococcoidia bacterium]|nr:hypothetical protein [Dehalococcoidia bacterium]
MLLLFLVAALAPVAVVLSIMLWRRYISRQEAAGSLIPGVAVGLAAGAFLGTGVALALLLGVFAIAHLRSH